MPVFYHDVMYRENTEEKDSLAKVAAISGVKLILEKCEEEEL